MNFTEDAKLAEKQAVMEVMFNYALAADTKDYDLMRSLMSGDAKFKCCLIKTFWEARKSCSTT